MSNSSLVAYTKISPNKTSPRNHAIDTITIHCVVGQVTAERLGDIFAPTTKKASSNYGVDKDGRIGMYVEEKDRSWCSSNAANDHRAITIEVASDTTAPYAVTDAAYNSLIKLVADICKRNGIKKLLWKADKSLIGQVDKQNMTVHRWFANKSCPGEYLYSRHADIAAKVNALLGAEQKTPAPTDMTDEAMFNYFKSCGLTDAGAAGLMGNLYAESSLRSNNLQNSYEKSLGLSDAEYTAQVDSGAYTNFVKDKAGYGLAQWTYWSRKEALLKFMKAAGVSIADKTKQCEFLMSELKGYKHTLEVLKSTTSVKEASDVVLTEFEKPANMSDAVKAKRASYAQGYYDKYAAKKSTVKLPATPFSVKVLIADLNYRSEPSMNGTVKGQTGRGTFTITEVKNGWGKLKSGVGWIYLENPDYVTVLGSTATSKYYNKYVGTSDSLVSALAAVGEKDTSLAHRTKIAKANGIANYTGTASQNLALVALLKQGKLIKA